MKSKTKISEQLKRKTSSEIVETVISAKKHNGWLEVAAILSGPRKNHITINLSEINKQAGEKEVIVIPGKVLSVGDLTKKVKISALNCSEKAREKILKSGSKILSISEEIKQNPDAKSVKILK